jgi:hypothetical protein
MVLPLLATGGYAMPPQVPSPEEILASLRPRHPRLLVEPDTWDRTRTLIRTNAIVRSWYERLRAEAKRLLRQPPLRYEIPDGLRLLGVSRGVLGRVYTLALLY